MDALALLCTLHADGPATLKALRGLGALSLADVVAADPKRVAEGIGMTPASARRLVREARILAQRLDLEGLDAEEAPPEVAARGGDAPEPPPTLPVEAPAGPEALAPADLDLVSRIVADAPAAESAAESAAGPAAEVDEPEPAVEPAPPVDEPERAAAPEEVTAPPAPAAAPGEIVTGGLPGLDGTMVEDLAAAGITTYGQLAAAESLSLTRNLGVTFAQARRLRFLARRAADEPTAEGGTVAEPELREVELTPRVAASQVAPSPVEAPAEAPPEAALPEAVAPELEPAADAAPAEPVAEEATPALPASDIAEDEPARPYDRKAFWESRLLEQAETRDEPEGEPQGVKVDPNEIAARPRFGDQFARAARERQAQRPPSPSGRTILGWNFEIPRPEAEPLPFASMGSGAAGAPAGDEPVAEPVAQEGRGDDGPQEATTGKESGEAAGPFA